MLDERVRAVLARMEEEDERDVAAGLPVSQRSLPVGPDTGRLLFALVAAGVIAIVTRQMLRRSMTPRGSTS